jgi:hypothetical protein
MTPEELTPVTETEVGHEFDELDVDAPLVGIVMGSKSDMPLMERPARSWRSEGCATRCA